MIVGASIHEGHHQRYVYRWITGNGPALARVPNAAFTVCLAIRSENADERVEAQAFAQLFEKQANWKPNVSAVFAGALRYSEYNWLVRMVPDCGPAPFGFELGDLDFDLPTDLRGLLAGGFFAGDLLADDLVFGLALRAESRESMEPLSFDAGQWTARSARSSVTRVSRQALLLVLFCAGCGTTLLAPLPKGATLATASLGGPAVLFGGVPVPTPVSTVGAARGVSDAVAVRAALHPTAAAFGVAGLDLGAVWHPLPEQRARLALGLDAYVFENGRDAVLLADPWVGTRLPLAAWFALGGGVHLPIRMASTDRALRALSPVAPTLFLQPTFITGPWEWTAELRWYALATCGSCTAPEWVSPGGQGAFGVIFGAAYQFTGMR